MSPCDTAVVSSVTLDAARGLDRKVRVAVVQVEHIRLISPGLKPLGCQPVESTSPFKVSGFRCVNLHHYSKVEHDIKTSMADAPARLGIESFYMVI